MFPVEHHGVQGLDDCRMYFVVVKWFLGVEALGDKYRMYVPTRYLVLDAVPVVPVVPVFGLVNRCTRHFQKSRPPKNGRFRCLIRWRSRAPLKSTQGGGKTKGAATGCVCTLHKFGADSRSSTQRTLVSLSVLRTLTNRLTS
jgi:hypothetical protein